jgi:hypothetical protein
MDATESEELDPKAALDLMADTREKAKRSLEINGAWLYGAWAMSWLIGFGVIWLSVRGDATYRTPPGWAFLVMGVCTAAALAVSFLTIGRALHGVTGFSSTSTKLYGWTWAISYACLFLIIAGLGNAGGSVPVVGLFASAGPAFVVSIMFLVSGALWHYWTMFVVGAWLALTIGVAVLFGVMTFDLIMALAGGGGFLAAALYEAHLQRS